MVDQSVQAYCDDLAALGIEYEILEHPPAREFAELLDGFGLSFSDCVPTLIMKAGDHFLAVLIRGDTRADFKKIKKALGIRDLRMASPEEFTQVTGLPVGTARVYTPGLRTILDARLFEKEYLTGGSGRFDYSIKVKAADLAKIPGSIVADVSSPPPGP
jgi:prolyl-tRNA editing enzyme YbaK/EbsC (Cys-tRNA(Pro) deacylase)